MPLVNYVAPAPYVVIWAIVGRGPGGLWAGGSVGPNGGGMWAKIGVCGPKWVSVGQNGGGGGMWGGDDVFTQHFVVFLLLGSSTAAKRHSYILEIVNNESFNNVSFISLH